MTSTPTDDSQAVITPPRHAATRIAPRPTPPIPDWISRMTQNRPTENWNDLKARLSREWAQTLTQLADARARADFAGWKPSSDR